MSRTAPRAPRVLGRRPVLDGIRGIAVLLVMLMHTGVLLGGDVGVDLFFGLSGFLITTLLCEESERLGAISLRRFYGRRARRLLPALLVLVALMALIGVVCWPLSGWPLQLKALSTLLFVNNWVVALGHASDLGALTPSWSLAQEEQFYLIWPLVLSVLLRRRLRPSLIVVLLAAGAGSALLLAPYVAANVPGYNTYFDPIDRWAELLIGSAAALVWRHRLLSGAAAWRRLGAGPARMLRRAAPAAGQLLALALAFAFALLVLDQNPGPIPRGTYLGALVLGVSLMLVLLGLEGRGLARPFSWRPLRFLGRISYALYLFHLPVYYVVCHYLPTAPLLLDAAITMAASMTLATLSWYGIESRILAVPRPAAGNRMPARQTGSIRRPALTVQAGSSRALLRAPGLSR